MDTGPEGTTSAGGAGGGGMVDRARETASQLRDEVQDRANSALDTVRGEAGNWQASLADALDSGAEAIRGRVGGHDGGTQGAKLPKRVSGAGEALAGTLERSALWLRENDLSDLGTMLRGQLREHPGRTALVALGIGIMLGRSSRR